MSLGGLMCKYKHIGTDVGIRPYVSSIFGWCLSQKRVLNRIEHLDANVGVFRTKIVTSK